MGRLLREATIDMATEKSGIKVRRLNEMGGRYQTSTPVPHIEFRKEANIAAQAILKEIERFLRKSYAADKEAFGDDHPAKLKDYLAANTGTHAGGFYDSFCKSVEMRLDALIRAKHET